MKTAIVTDSNSGIFETEGIRLGVHVLPMPVLIDNQVYFEGQNLSSQQAVLSVSAGGEGCDDFPTVSR